MTDADLIRFVNAQTDVYGKVIEERQRSGMSASEVGCVKTLWRAIARLIGPEVKLTIEPNLKAWKPGQSGNLNGRPVGSRTAFSAGFLKDLAEIWSEEGRGAMPHTAKTNPTVFFATCAR